MVNFYYFGVQMYVELQFITSTKTIDFYFLFST